MTRGPYDPPVTTALEPVAARLPARWKWLFVPIGHTILIFFAMIGWWMVWPAMRGAPITDWLPDAELTRWIAKQALFQGAVLLFITVVLVGALPRIHIRQAAYIALVSGGARFFVSYVDTYFRESPITNGEDLMRTVVTYGAVLLICGLAVRKAPAAGA